jgi:VanZ family protein
MYPWLLWLCLIWIVSSVPSRDLPSIKVISVDKLAHIAVYAILGLLINPWFRQMGWKGRKRWIAYGVLLMLAALDESHQRFIPGRTVSIYDWVANACGLLIGFVVSRDK